MTITLVRYKVVVIDRANSWGAHMVLFATLALQLMKQNSLFSEPLLPYASNWELHVHDVQNRKVGLRNSRRMAVTQCNAQLTLTFYDIPTMQHHAQAMHDSGKLTRAKSKIRVLRKAGLTRGWIASSVMCKHEGHGLLKKSQLSLSRTGIDVAQLRKDATEHNIPLVSVQSMLSARDIDIPAQTLRNLLKDRDTR